MFVVNKQKYQDYSVWLSLALALKITGSLQTNSEIQPFIFYLFSARRLFWDQMGDSSAGVPQSLQQFSGLLHRSKIFHVQCYLGMRWTSAIINFYFCVSSRCREKQISLSNSVWVRADTGVTRALTCRVGLLWTRVVILFSLLMSSQACAVVILIELFNSPRRVFLGVVSEQ